MPGTFPRHGLTGNRGAVSVLAAVVFLAGFLTFAGTVVFDFVWDDLALIRQVENALSEGEPGRLFTSSFHVKVQQSARYYRPVMMASLLFDVIVTGGAPWFSHLVNIFLHALNGVLVLLVLRRIIGNGPGALAGALLFAVHPVHAEVVAVVSSRMDLLALTLLLPAALVYAVPEGSSREVWWPVRILVPVFFFLACLTKETAFMFPLLLLFLLILRGRNSWRNGIIGIIPVFLAAGAAFLARFAVFAVESHPGAASGLRAGAVLPDFSVVRILKLLMVNMGMAVNPFPERFHWFSGDLDFEWGTFLGAVLFLVLLALVLKRNRDCAVRGTAWWSLFIFPVLGIFNLGQSLAAERYAYIPSVGICLMVGGLVASLPSPLPARRLFRGMAAAVAVLLMVAAAAHARNWKNEVTLFSRVVETNPSYADGYVNLGVALARKGRHEDALTAYNKAQALAPGETMAAFNRGNLFESIGRHQEALASFDAVLEKDPDDWEASLNRGNVLAKLGRFEEAAKSYEKALDDSGMSGKPLVGLGVLAAREGRYEKALELFTAASEREPDLSEAFQGMGESLLFLGKAGEAKGAFFRAIEISPRNTMAALRLGEILMKEGQPFQAVHAFRAALASDPSSIGAWVGLIRALEVSGMDQKVPGYLRELEMKDPVLAGKVRRALGVSSP